MADDKQAVEALGIKLTFSPREYFSKDDAGRIKLLQDMVRQNQKILPDFDWSEFKERFDSGSPVIASCTHEAATLKMAVALLDREAENRILRERMEDLCAEMERVRQGEGRTFILGPGTETKNAS